MSKRLTTILIFLIALALVVLFMLKSSDEVSQGDVTVILGAAAIVVVGAGGIAAFIRKRTQKAKKA
jgi:hypothetical protein